MKDGGNGPRVDPFLPRWICQNCRHAICVTGVENFADKFSDPSRSGMQASSIQSSVLGVSRMDQSFVVLPKQKAGIPPRPQSRTMQQSEAVLSGKTMEESFVVLPPAAASMYNCESTSEGGGSQLAAPGDVLRGPMLPNNPGFQASITVLNRAFEIAASQTQVEQPLCLECLRVLSDKLDKEVEDVTRDIKAYEVCLQRQQLQSFKILSEDEFLREKMKVQDEEKKLQDAIEEIEKQCSEVDAEMKDLESNSNSFKDLEERYWTEFDSFHYRVRCHQDERDAIMAKTEVCQARLDCLKCTNVLNDAFHISHEGEFGTINNFRLGRIPDKHGSLVEWDEVNAAWGQACLLLHTMAQHFRPKFPYRIKILPMGSYPRIMDANNNTYELFGPVNLFWSTRYDKAMTLFLACLKEFAEFANSLDQENNIPPEKCLKLPYRIEKDKVEGYAITHSFNNSQNWIKALKYTLCNLKWMLYWFVGNTNFQPLPAAASYKIEGTSARMSCSK